MNKEFTPKLFSTLKEGLTIDQVKKDIASGILVGIIALPLAIAFAIASGVSPEKGIITAIIAGLIISVLGGSRVQIGGPTGAFIVVVSSILAQYGYSGLLISTFLAGIIIMLMGVLRMGALLKYIPQTLITGFTTAIAVIIFTTQIMDFLGITQPGLPDSFSGKWIFYITNIQHSSFLSILIGVMTLAIIILLPKLTKKIPPAFAAIVITTLLVRLAHWPVDTIYSRFGNLNSAIPKLQIPHFTLTDLPQYLSPAITIAILGSLESLLSAVVSDGMIGGSHRSNMELIAQGLANIMSSLFGGLPATGAIARTAANINNGGRTPLAGVIHGLTLFVIYIVAMPIVKYIPMATLAGILIIVAWGMGEFREFFHILKINVYEALVLLTTFFLTLFLDLTIAIPVGFVLAVILFMKRMADSVELSPLLIGKTADGKTLSEELGSYSDHIVIFELNGPMFFGSVHHLLTVDKRLKDHEKVLILRFRYVPIVDSSGLKKLQFLIEELEKKEILVLFSGVNDRLNKKFTGQKILDGERIFYDIHPAIEYAEKIFP